MIFSRRLRSKRLRAALWRKAEGRCESCGIELPDEWHADHIVPWSKTRRTNVHEMQALCPTCNLKKGDRMNLRRYQQEFDDAMRDVAGGGRRRTILVQAAPGAGKSLLPQILAHRLIPSTVDRVCWVVPRLNLQYQGALGFKKERNRGLVGHRLEIYESTNDTDPSRGTAGYITTYNAIAQNPELHRHEFCRFRYALILDEPHHVREGESFHRALVPIYERAIVRVLMSGTFDRHDGKPIAFVPYADTASGSRPDLGDAITYGLRDALEDRAILRADFTHVDSSYSFIDREGGLVEGASVAESAGASRDALFTSLSTEYATELLSRCYESWRAYRAASSVQSGLLVVAKSQLDARKYCKWLEAHGTRAGLAINDEKNSQARIKRFMAGKLDALVTVQMAYEGLDVPRISHLAALTHIRSAPWIFQMIARAMRVDPAAGSWSDQVAHIFCPDDPEFHSCIEHIRAEQARALAEMRDGAVATARENNGDPIAPLGSEATRARASELVGDLFDYSETTAISSAMEREGIHGVTPAQFKRAMVRFGAAKEPEGSIASAPMLTPKERMTNLRNSIEKRVRKVVIRQGGDFKDVNREIYAAFGKSRKDMSESELSRVWNWVLLRYPLDDA